MTRPSLERESLLTALADGEAVDWASADQAATTPDDRDFVRDLRVLAQVVEVYRAVSGASASETDPSAGRASPPTMLAAGTQWGGLRIVGLLGRGTFGDIYRARDHRLDRDVALKILRVQPSTDRAESTEVVAEGRLLARVRHANVVAVHGADCVDGHVGVWMELIEGQTLEDELQARGAMSAADVTSIGVDLCGALAAIHDAGLLHRDVKAHNVMRDARDGRIVLMDFSAGRDLSLPARRARLPMSVAGSPIYLAPEVLAGSPATPRGDIYSLGVLLFHLLTNAFPVNGRTLEEIAEAHATGERRSLTSDYSAIPRRLSAAIDVALDPDPARRYASARAFGGALEASRPAHWTAQPVMRWGGLALVSLIVALVGAVASRRANPPPLATARPGAGIVVQQVFPDFQRDVSIRGPAHEGRWVPCARRNSGSIAICDLEDLSVKVLRAPQEGKPGGVPRSRALISADGRRLAYLWSVGRGKDERVSLHVIDVATAADTALFEVTGNIVLRQWLSSPNALHITAVAGGEPARDLLVPLAGGPPRPLWSWTDDANSTALSPDGRTLVVARRVASGNRDLFAIDVATGREVWRLADPADDFLPVWTPNGRAIAFARDRAAGSQTILIAAVGEAGLSTPAVLHDFGRNRVTGEPVLAFAKDGSLFMDVMTGGLRTAYVADVDLDRVSVGSSRALEPHSIEDSMGPDWSPDGARIAYLRGIATHENAKATLVIRRADGDVERERILPGRLLPWQGQVRWSPDEDHLAVLYSSGGASVLGVLHLQRNDLTTIATDVMNPRWNASGSALFYSKGGQVHRFDLRTRAPTVFYKGPPPVRAEVVDVSRQQQHILGRIPPNRTCRIGVFHPGAQQKIVEFDNPACTTARWVGDGPQFLVSLAPSPTKGEVWLANADTGDRRLLPLESEAVVDMALSPNRRRLLYSAGNPRPIVWMMSGIDTRDVSRNSVMR